MPYDDIIHSQSITDVPGDTEGAPKQDRPTNPWELLVGFAQNLLTGFSEADEMFPSESHGYNLEDPRVKRMGEVTGRVLGRLALTATMGPGLEAVRGDRPARGMSAEQIRRQSIAARRRPGPAVAGGRRSFENYTNMRALQQQGLADPEGRRVGRQTMGPNPRYPGVSKENEHLVEEARKMEFGPGADLEPWRTESKPNRLQEPEKWVMPMDTDSIRAISDRSVQLHESSGRVGSTNNPRLGDLAGKPFIAVSLYPELTELVPGNEVPADVMAKYMRRNAKILAENPHLSVGTWFDESKGQTYIDVVATLPRERAAEAIGLGKAANQVAAFDLESFTEIPTGGTGEFTPEVMQALGPIEGRINRVMDGLGIKPEGLVMALGGAQMQPTRFGRKLRENWEKDTTTFNVDGDSIRQRINEAYTNNDRAGREVAERDLRDMQSARDITYQEYMANAQRYIDKIEPVVKGKIDAKTADLKASHERILKGWTEKEKQLKANLKDAKTRLKELKAKDIRWHDTAGNAEVGRLESTIRQTEAYLEADKGSYLRHATDSLVRYAEGLERIYNSDKALNMPADPVEQQRVAEGKAPGDAEGLGPFKSPTEPMKTAANTPILGSRTSGQPVTTVRPEQKRVFGLPEIFAGASAPDTPPRPMHAALPEKAGQKPVPVDVEIARGKNSSHGESFDSVYKALQFDGTGEILRQIINLSSQHFGQNSPQYRALSKMAETEEGRGLLRGLGHAHEIGHFIDLRYKEHLASVRGVDPATLDTKTKLDQFIAGTQREFGNFMLRETSAWRAAMHLRGRNGAPPPTAAELALIETVLNSYASQYDGVGQYSQYEKGPHRPDAGKPRRVELSPAARIPFVRRLMRSILHAYESGARKGLERIGRVPTDPRFEPGGAFGPREPISARPEYERTREDALAWEQSLPPEERRYLFGPESGAPRMPHYLKVMEDEKAFENKKRALRLYGRRGQTPPDMQFPKPKEK